MTVTKPERRTPSRRWMFLAATTVLLVIATVIFTILAGTFKPVAPGSPISAMNGWAIHGLPRAQLDEQLAAMEARGVKVFRDDASWRSIEPLAPGPRGPVYRFGGEDAEVCGARRPSHAPGFR